MTLLCGQKLESTWILLILFHRRTIFKMLALEQSAEKWLFSAGGGSPASPTPSPPARPSPFGYGPA